MPLQDLRTAREAEIEALNFEEVELINAAIANYTTDNTQSIIDRAKAELGPEIDQAFETYTAEEDSLRILNTTNENNVRSAANELFQAAKSRHLEEITALEADRELRLIRGQSRSSAAFIDLTATAKKLARNNDIAGAIHVRQSATAKRDQEMQARADAINGRFDKALAFLNAKQIAELSYIEDNLQKELDKIAVNLEQGKFLNQRKLAGVVRRIVRGKIAVVAAELGCPTKKAEITEALTAFVKQKLADEDRAFAFQRADE
jgi:hypothetical protein